MKRKDYSNPEKNLEWFKAFVNICEKNKIWYTVYGGTMLGAIREKGKIPWDDDYDVIMTKKSYEKLKKLFPQNCLDGVANTKHPHAFIKFVPDFLNLQKRAIFIDIFIICPTTREKIKKLSSFKNKYRALITYLHSFLKFSGILMNFLRVITWPASFFVKKINYETSFSELNTPVDYDVFYIMITPWNIKEHNILDKKNGLKTKLVPFEDFEVRIICRYDELLTQQFGDYMIPVNDGIKHSSTFPV